jgi:beta-N-acetylhexosaminidase
MLPVIFSCAGLTLSAEEQRFFEAVQPVGFILFARNCDNRAQVRDLVASLKACVPFDPVPILIDQEGGRVMRLAPPEWPQRKPAWFFYELWKDNPDRARIAAFDQARSIAADLTELGITVNCAPVLDIPAEGSHAIISNRAYGNDIAAIIDLGRATAEGFLENGVIPIIKHIPGHGRATVDSHEHLPVVTATREILHNTDFAPFTALHTMPWAMTAHIVYNDIDKNNPATFSKTLIENVMREEIGFSGVLLSDDVNMKALPYSVGENARRALEAGCDVALHCSGVLQEMQEIAAAVPAIRKESWERLQQSLSACLG